MSSLLQTIVPKSDQMNADSLVGGSRTITITGVDVKVGGEQPVAIHYEGEDGRPYLPCKSMRRCLVQIWGADGNKYVGKSMTLYCDPAVKFGGMAVGGIRISHMSGITEQKTLALTATRGKKAAFVVKPLEVTGKAAAPSSKPKKSAKERGAAMVLEFAKLDVTLPMIEQRIGHPIDEITDADISDLGAAYVAVKGGLAKEDYFEEPEPPLGDAAE